MLELPVSVRHIVAHSVPQDIVQRLRLGHLLAPLAYDNDELALVVKADSFLCQRRNWNGVGRSGQRCQWLVEQNGELGLGKTRLFGVQSIVEAETPHRPCLLRSKRRQQVTDVMHLIGDLVFAKDITRDDASLPSLGDVCHTLAQDGITVVCLGIAGNEADETLRVLC